MKCSRCNGKGILIIYNMEIKEEVVKRCDECKKYDLDHDAQIGFLIGNMYKQMDKKNPISLDYDEITKKTLKKVISNIKKLEVIEEL